MSKEPRSLNIDAIVGAAIEVAEDKGVGAVTMRNVGQRLGFTGMSLYRHVENKNALLDLMADHVIGEVPDIETDLSWDDAIVKFFTGLHNVVLKHRTLAAVFTLRPTGGRNTQRHSQLVLTLLTDSGFPADKAVEVYIALACYTLGSALYTAGRDDAAESDPAWIGLAGDNLGPISLARLRRRTHGDQFLSGLQHFVRGFANDLPQSGDVPGRAHRVEV